MPGGGNQVLYLFLAAGVGLLCLGILQLIGDLRSQDKKRLKNRLAGFSSEAQAAPDHVIRDVVSAKRSLVAKLLSSEGLGARIRDFLTQADVPWPAHQVVTGICVIIAAVAVLGLVLTQIGLNLEPWVAAIMAGSAGILPILILMVRRSMRLNKISEQLPELFEMLGQTLRAGHALITGIQLAGEQMPHPLGKELARVYQEQSFGAKLEDSLGSLAKRVGLLDVQMFVTSVLIQRQTGGDLAEVLDKSGKVIRGRIELGRQVRALTAEGRMSGWVLALLPMFISLLMYKVNPSYMETLFFGEAQFLLKIGIGMNVLGFLLIQKLVKIKY